MFGSEISVFPNEEGGFPNRKIITMGYFFNKSFHFPNYFWGNGKLKMPKTRMVEEKLGQEFTKQMGQ